MAKVQKRVKMSTKIPSPPKQPFIGNLLAFRKDRLGFFQQVAHEYGDIVGYQLGNMPFVLLNHPDYIHWLLVQQHEHFERSPIMLMMKPILGKGLLTAVNASNG